ncbi:hypothetical protein [Sphingomonas sp. PAMC 26605]|uniref:hypothetical protein n=1 Tax=Sphingomonas sp. PAMC 26605 TaxID=1112214 RepID=UPI0012F519DF|nr:hypothetical protein [Sphingomonas sp. PAMC 26605]
MRVFLYPTAMLALALAACGAQPPAKANTDIVVVRGSPAALDAAVFAKQPNAAVAATPAIAPGTPQPRQLTVAESARIHTSEMWSEPLPAN